MRSYITKNSRNLAFTCLLLGFGSLSATRAVMAETVYLGSGYVADTEDSSAYYNIGLEGEINQYLDYGLNYTIYDANFENSAGLYLKPNYEIDDVTLYSNIGINDRLESLDLGLGMAFTITSKFAIDVSYNYTRNQERNLYSGGINLLYNFGAKPASTKSISEPTSVQSTVDEIKQVTKLGFSGEDGQCKQWLGANATNTITETGTYRVTKGDMLIRIAEAHCLSLELLMDLNEWIKPIVANNGHYIYPGESLIIPTHISL